MAHLFISCSRDGNACLINTDSFVLLSCLGEMGPAECSRLCSGTAGSNKRMPWCSVYPFHILQQEIWGGKEIYNSIKYYYIHFISLLTILLFPLNYKKNDNI